MNWRKIGRRTSHFCPGPGTKWGFCAGILCEFNVTKKFRARGSVFPYVNFALE